MSGPNCDKCGDHCGVCLCGQGLPPTPAKLSPEMLGEDDRNYLRIITMIADIHQPTDCEASRRAIAWADRLLESNKEGE